ncbi:hypothetical protein Tco_0798133 [Tanacetum coccineum]
MGNMSTHKKIFVNPFQTKKFFANMKRAGKDFSGRITPLFDTMMVQPKKQPSKKAQRQEAEVPQDEAEHEESVPTPSNDPQPSGEDSLQLTDLMVLCTKLQTQVLDLQKAKDAQAKEIAALKKRIQRLERRKMSRPTGLKRLRKVGMIRRVESSKDQESLGAPEDASKQGRSIEDIDADVDVSLVDETQERQDDDLMFDTMTLQHFILEFCKAARKQEEETKKSKEEDKTLEALWRIVKAKYGDTRPEDEFERVLYGDLRVMFEPDIKSDVWRMLQGYRVTTWKRYPLTPITITNMLNKKLQTDATNGDVFINFEAYGKACEKENLKVLNASPEVDEDIKEETKDSK